MPSESHVAFKEWTKCVKSSEYKVTTYCREEFKRYHNAVKKSLAKKKTYNIKNGQNVLNQKP